MLTLRALGSSPSRLVSSADTPTPEFSALRTAATGPRRSNSLAPAVRASTVSPPATPPASSVSEAAPTPEAPTPEASGTSEAPPKRDSKSAAAAPAETPAPAAAVEGSAPEAVNGAPADPALPTGKGDLGVAEAPEADATAGAESATTIDEPPPAEAATTAEATAAAAQAEHQPPADAPAEPAAESGTETTAKEQAEAGTEAAAEPAAKPKPGTRKATQSKTKAGAKPAKKAPAKKAAAEAGAATGAKAAAEDDAPPAAKPAAKAATRPRSRSAAKPDATADAKPDATADAKAPAAKSKSTRKSTRKRRLQYKVGQQLVYPLQGVGQVRTIEERPFRNQTLLYYMVYLEVSDMTIMVPVDKADELGIRAIVPRAEARSALTLIGEDYEPIPTDWKLRYQMNLDLLKAGSVSDIATVVRALYHRSRIKELPILERKLYDNARSLLVDELSFSLAKDKVKVEELINSRLEVGVK